MARRVLVTGATGTVGGEVMRILTADNMAGQLTLVGAARSDKSAEALLARGMTPVDFDFDRPETMRAALTGVDSIFLVTGYTVNMVVHSNRLLDAARAEGVRHIVHLGALAAEDTPHAHFAWHQMVERSIEAMGFDWTHLRPNFFMDTVWIGYRRRPDRLVHFVGDHKVSWIAASDIAAVAAQALRNPETHAGQTLNLASEAISFPELSRQLSSVTGRDVAYRPRPASDLLPLLLKQGMEPTYAAGLAESMAALETGQLPLADSVYDTVEIVLGRSPVSWRSFAEARLDQLSD